MKFNSLIIASVVVGIAATAWFFADQPSLLERKSPRKRAEPSNVSQGKTLSNASETAIRSSSRKEESPSAPSAPGGSGQSEKSLVDALRESLLEVSEDSRLRKFLESIERMGPADAAAVWKLFLEFDKLGVRFPTERAAFWRRWGEIDAKGAVEYLSKQPAERWVGGAFERAFEGWATKDATAAQQWLAANTEHPQFELAFLGFLDGFTKIDLQAATRFTLSSLPPEDPMLAKAMGRLSEQVFAQNFGAGLRSWFETLPEGAARSAAVYPVYERLLRQGIPPAAEWLRAQAATPWRSNAAIGNLAYRYSANDPSAAMNWVQTLPLSKSKRSGDEILFGVGEIVSQWSRSDPSGLEQWLAANRGTQAFEQAAHDYAIILGGRDKEKARFWAEQVTQRRLRAEALAAAGAPAAGRPD